MSAKIYSEVFFFEKIKPRHFRENSRKMNLTVYNEWRSFIWTLYQIVLIFFINAHISIYKMIQHYKYIYLNINQLETQQSKEV